MRAFVCFVGAASSAVCRRPFCEVGQGYGWVHMGGRVGGVSEKDVSAGKSPRQGGREGPAAVPSLGGRMFGRPAIVQRSHGRREEIALTFDDGPSLWTAEVAGVFGAHGCRATFFLRGPAVEERPEAVAALAAAGHELGNHLWSHSDSSALGCEELRAELERTADAVEAAGGPRPELVRPPYFKGPENVAEAAAGCGVRAVILRSIAVSDWKARSAEEIYEPVMERAAPGDIVCLHDGISSDERDTDSRRPTADAVARLVPALLERGLRPVTVSQLLG